MRRKGQGGGRERRSDGGGRGVTGLSVAGVYTTTGGARAMWVRGATLWKAWGRGKKSKEAKRRACGREPALCARALSERAPSAWLRACVFLFTVMLLLLPIFLLYTALPPFLPALASHIPSPYPSSAPLPPPSSSLASSTDSRLRASSTLGTTLKLSAGSRTTGQRD